MKVAEVSTKNISVNEETELERLLSQLLVTAGIPARIDVSVTKRFCRGAEALCFRLVPFDCNS